MSVAGGTVILSLAVLFLCGCECIEKEWQAMTVKFRVNEIQMIIEI